MSFLKGFGFFPRLGKIFRKCHKEPLISINKSSNRCESLFYYILVYKSLYRAHLKSVGLTHYFLALNFGS
jgi:hypothetical protein